MKGGGLNGKTKKNQKTKAATRRRRVLDNYNFRTSLLERIERLYDRLHMLKSILQHYDALSYEEQDRAYMEDLKRRIRITEGNLRSHGEDHVV